MLEDDAHALRNIQPDLPRSTSEISLSSAPGADHAEYCHTGVNILDILTRVAQRSMPQVSVGPVDMTCPMSVAHIVPIGPSQVPTVIFKDVSDDFLRLVRRTRDQVVGHSPVSVLPCAQHEMAKVVQMYTAAANGAEQQGVLQLPSTDQRPTPILMTLIPLLYRNPGPSGSSVGRVEWIVGFQARISPQFMARTIGAQLDTTAPPRPPTSAMHTPRTPHKVPAQPPAQDLSAIPPPGDASGTIHFVMWHDTLQYVSKSVEPLLGRRSEELIGKSVEELCHGNDMVALCRELKEIKNKSGKISSARARPTVKPVRLDENVSRHAVLAEANGLLRFHHKTLGPLWMETSARLVQQPGGSGRKNRTVIAVSGRRHKTMLAGERPPPEPEPLPMPKPAARTALPSKPAVSEQPALVTWLTLSSTGVILQCFKQSSENDIHSNEEPSLPVRIGFVLPNVIKHEASVEVQRVMQAPKKHPVSIATWITHTPVVSTWIPLTADLKNASLENIRAHMIVRLDVGHNGLDKPLNRVFEPEPRWLAIPLAVSESVKENDNPASHASIMRVDLGETPADGVQKPSLPSDDLFPWSNNDAWMQWTRFRDLADTGAPTLATGSTPSPLWSSRPVSQPQDELPSLVSELIPMPMPMNANPPQNGETSQADSFSSAPVAAGMNGPLPVAGTPLDDVLSQSGLTSMPTDGQHASHKNPSVSSMPMSISTSMPLNFALAMCQGTAEPNLYTFWPF